MTANWVKGVCFALAASASSCLVDADKVCGSSFEETPNQTCTCPKGQVVKSGVCVKAPAVKGDKDDTPATENTDAKGDTSESPPPAEADGAAAGEAGATDMASGEQTAETSAAEETTAAARCGSSQECSTDELCDVHETEQCQPKPDGLGDDCKTADDCAKTDATYCEAFSSHTCQVEACKELDGVCPGDLVCCEYSLLKRSLCIPPENLEAGDCPSSGTLIPRGEP